MKQKEEIEKTLADLKVKKEAEEAERKLRKEQRREERKKKKREEQNKYIKLITTEANTQHYDIRTRSTVYHVKAINLRQQIEPTNLVNDGEKNVEVILHRDLYSKVLPQLGLQKLSEWNTQIDQHLTQIGAIALVPIKTDFISVIRLEVLLTEMSNHKYLYSKTKDAGMESLTPKSIRVMNRLTRLFIRYHDANRDKFENKTGNPYPKIIQALFKDVIVKKNNFRSTT